MTLYAQSCHHYKLSFLPAHKSRLFGRFPVIIFEMWGKVGRCFDVKKPPSPPMVCRARSKRGHERRIHPSSKIKFSSPKPKVCVHGTGHSRHLYCSNSLVREEGDQRHKIPNARNLGSCAGPRVVSRHFWGQSVCQGWKN